MFQIRIVGKKIVDTKGDKTVTFKKYRFTLALFYLVSSTKLNLLVVFKKETILKI